MINDSAGAFVSNTEFHHRSEKLGFTERSLRSWLHKTNCFDIQDTTFTDAIQTAMNDNNVSSIASSTITSDTTSAPKDAGTLNPNNSNEAGNEVGNDDSNDNTVSVEPDCFHFC